MINFTKMNGLGNDYVFIDCTDGKNTIANPSSFSKVISNRNFGIGSDGLILIENSKVADFKMRIFNSDGSEAEMCGNGIRCVGKFLYDKKLISKTTIEIETLAGIKKIQLKLSNSRISSVSVCMGEAKILDDFELTVADETFSVTPVLIGNPHAVVFVNNLANINFNKYAPIIESHQVFPNKTNVEFVQVINPNLIKVKVWERGSGETLACGTGACASTAVAYNKKFIYKSVNVEMPGGFLQTYLDTNSNNIYLSGPASTVYEGVYFN